MKNSIYIVLLLLIVPVTACVNQEQSRLPNAKIIEIDPGLQQVLSTDVSIELLAEGFNWSEGPVWVEAGNYLLFSDVPENKIYKWEENTGVSVFLEPSGYTGTEPREGENGSNGLLIDHQGNLLLCQHGDRRVARLTLDDPNATFETIVDRFEGNRFNSPNDLVQDSYGRLYFTDPPYGLPKNKDTQEKKELEFQGVYRIDPSGSMSLLHKNLSRPNGIALSPDEKTLYVANSDPKNPIIMKFQLDTNYDIEREDLFFDTKDLEGPGLPDGMVVNADGTVFATGPGGVLILDPDGKHLGTIYTGEATANVTLDSKEEYLYITADSYLLRVKVK